MKHTLLLAVGLLLFVWVTFALYVLIMGFYRAHLAGRLSRPVFYAALPWLAVGLVFDVLLQLLATAPFLDVPRYAQREWLFSERMTRYLRGRPHWRQTLAAWICEHLLDPFDPSGTHCG